MTNWLAELDGHRIVVEVPASSANLGAGYDCLAIALGLTNRIEFEVRGWSRGSIELSVDGQGVDELSEDRENRCVLGVEAALRAIRGEIPEGVGWRIDMRNEIPLARGLGSSAAATVAGLVAGNAFLGEPLTQADLLRLATEIEGHPDNAAAALLGGFVVSAAIDGAVEALRFDAPRDLRAILFVPELRLATKRMREVLPEFVPRADAVANLTRVAIGVAGISIGRFDLLRLVTVDRLHEPYRAAAFPQLPQFVAAARGAGAIGACLSGAGSSIIAFSDSVRTITRIEGAFAAASADTDLPGRILVVSPRNAGAQVVDRR
ncbi:MAG TPA: homoserine kinase [Candidatus Limnocylindrales bacterium]|nr:homoserine kinase [Candidatus Limnocylindrales bacterium]